jgi:flavodoxin
MMKALVVYDSTYGNTEKIAKAIGGAITGDVKVLRAGEVNPAELNSYDLLVIGSPTYGGRPMPSMLELLNKIPESSIKGKNVAAFDTRLTSKIVKIFGFAAGRIANSLKDKGGNLVVPAEGFFVTVKEGPLKEGELERAANWAKELAKGNSRK